MPAPFNTIDLATLALKPGEGRRLEVELQLEGLELAGEGYDFGGQLIPARMEISRTASGHAMRIRFTARLQGPCMRCLTGSGFEVGVDSREVDLPGTGDEDLASPYVDQGQLDVGAWAHDAIALALPPALLCRPDCAGLCPECGVSLNDVDPSEHAHESAPDPRWAKLRELM